MTELLKTLYWNLYTPYENQETEQELDDCHKQPIDGQAGSADHR